MRNDLRLLSWCWFIDFVATNLMLFMLFFDIIFDGANHQIYFTFLNKFTVL